MNMYAQIEKPKEHKSRAVTNAVVQNKSVVKQHFEFVDNRPEAVAQRKLVNMNPSLQKEVSGYRIDEATVQRIGAQSNTFRLVVNGVTRDEIDEAIDNIPGGNGGYAELNGNAGFNVVIYAMNTLPVSTVRNSLRNQLPNAIIGAITRSVEN
jgi:hypothetical protein